jgi:tetratricopeptide (TPR) repeat protein
LNPSIHHTTSHHTEHINSLVGRAALQHRYERHSEALADISHAIQAFRSSAENKRKEKQKLSPLCSGSQKYDGRREMRGLAERMDRLGVSVGFDESELGRGKGARTGTGETMGQGEKEKDRQKQKEKEIGNHYKRGDVDIVASENDVRKGRGDEEGLITGKHHKKENCKEEENEENEGKDKGEKEGEKEGERVERSDDATLLSLLSFRASLYSKLDQHTHAISDLTEAINIPEIHQNSRGTVQRHGNSSYTGKDYRSNLYFSRGLSLKRVGSYPEAVCDFTAAIELCDRHSDTSTGINIENSSSSSSSICKSSSFVGGDCGDGDEEGEGDEEGDGDRRDRGIDIDTDCHINNNNSNSSSSSSNNNSSNRNSNSESRRSTHRSTDSRRSNNSNSNSSCNSTSNSTIDDKHSNTDSHPESTYCRTVMRTSAVTHRAYCQRKLGNFRESLDDYTTVILLSPTNIQV